MLDRTRETRILLIVTVAIFFAVSASARIIKGTATLKLVSIRAIKPNLSPDPSKNLACRSKFSDLTGKVATTIFMIDTSTFKTSASTRFEMQTYELSALGISQSYSFGKFFHPPQLPRNLYGVLFSLNLQGRNPVTDFLYTLDSETNCVVSSASNPFKTAPAGRFGRSGS